MESKDLKRLKELEEENSKLKRMYANLALDLEAARYIIEKSFKALPKAKHNQRDKNRNDHRHQQGVSSIGHEPKKFLLPKHQR